MEGHFQPRRLRICRLRVVQKSPFLIQSSAGAWRAFGDSYNTTWLIKHYGFIAPDVFRQKQLQFAAKTACVQSGVPETAGTIGHWYYSPSWGQIASQRRRFSSDPAGKRWQHSWGKWASSSGLATYPSPLVQAAHAPS